MPFFKCCIHKILALLANTDDPQKGDALIGFRQTVAGAVPRTVHDKLGEVVSVKDFGAKGDGQADDTAAIQAAVNNSFISKEGGAVFFPAGNYIVTAEILISNLRISLHGAGRYATMISFSPALDNQSLFKFDRGAEGVLWQCAIRDMALVASDDTGLTKTAIELKDTSNMIVKDLIIGPWTGNSNSIGLLVRGREAGHINNLHIQADRPLVIGMNGSDPIALDHFNFNDLYLLVTAGVLQPCIFIEDGVNLQNVQFGGFQAWVLGTHGLYWRDTTTTGVSLALVLRNVRTEQNTDPNGYSIYIEHNYELQDLLIENMVADLYQRGFFFRNIQRLTLRHVNYNGSDVALDVDKVRELCLDQVLIGVNSTVVMPNMQEKIAFNRLSSNSPVPDTAYFTQSVGTNPNQALNFFGGTKVWSFSGTLATGEELTVPAGNNQGRKAALISVSAISSDGQTSAGGQVMDTAKEAVRLTGTDNFGIGNEDGKLTVFHTAATTVFNKLGQPVDLLVFVVWT
jgi:pectate lyase-like protein